MRKVLESREGQRLYIFTTFGAVYAGIYEKLLEDIVQLRGADGKLLFINLSDVSGVRTYDETEAR